MLYWKDIIQSSLIGTGSGAELSKAAQEELASLGLVSFNVEEKEAALLHAMSIYALLRKSGKSLTRTLDKLPYEVAPEEVKPVCSNRANTILSLVIQKGQEELLKEFLEVIVELDHRIPEEQLPDLLSFGTRHESLRPFIQTVVGERGKWLAQFYANWKYVNSIGKALPESVFLHGKTKKRYEYLCQLRLKDAPKAIELLESVWSVDDHETRLQLMKALEVNLSEADIPFLENVLDDKRKELRKQAAQLLGQLPSSALVARMQTELSARIQFDAKKKEILVDLPDKLSAEMQRDGIEENLKPVGTEGKKSNWLAQIIAAVPPNYWENAWNCSIQDCLMAALASDFRNVFFWAWATAAERFGNEEWILALQLFLLDNHTKSKKAVGVSLDFSLHKLSDAIYNKVALEHLRRDANALLSDDHPLMNMLLIEGRKWNDELALQVIARINTAILQNTSVFNWNQKTLLKRAALAISPLLIEKVEALLPNDLNSSWQSEIGALLATLRFRLDIYNLRFEN